MISGEKLDEQFYVWKRARGFGTRTADVLWKLVVLPYMMAAINGLEFTLEGRVAR